MPPGHHAHVHVPGLFSPSPAAATWLHDRDLPLDDDHCFTQSQLMALRLTSLVMGSLSLLSTLFATFWFVRMSRSFRHDLIILLIQSDALKSIVFVVFPAIELSRGTVASDAAACQASGFFLAVGFEACDVAVVLVALHTALYIFRGRGGLHPYRRAAFALFLVIPLLFASLAFVNTPAFTNSGQYCHLPLKPRWASLALSWIPRYLILVTICVTHVSTYIHVQILMSRFGAACQERDGLAHHQAPASDSDADSAPPTPPTACHGLLAPTPPPCEGSVARSEKCPAASLAADGHAMAHLSSHLEEQRALVAGPLRHVGWQSSARPSTEPASDLDPAAPARRQTVSQPVSGSPAWLWTRAPATTEPAKTAEAATATSSSRIQTLLRRCGCSWRSSAKQRQAALGTTPAMAKMRDKIRRQLRQLFIYPAVYIVVWTVPFVSHVVGNATWDRPSFVLAVASLASLCVQGIVDTLVFCILEKPWRHPRHVGTNGALLRPWGASRGGPGQGNHGWGLGRSRSSSFLPCWPGLAGAAVHQSSGPGRTRDQMLVDSRAARLRRDRELAERRALRRAKSCTAATSPREWWDVRLGSLDGYDDDVMTTVAHPAVVGSETGGRDGRGQADDAAA